MNARTAASIFFALALAGCGGSGSSGGGTTTPPPTYAASLSATSLSFASTVGVQAPTQTVTLTNTGTGLLSLTSIAPVPAVSAFTVTASTCGQTLAVSSSCTLTVGYLPASAGTVTTTLTITDNATSSPQTVALSGTATAALPTYGVTIAPTSLTFPATSIGTSSPAQMLTVTNTGTGILTLTNVAVTGTNSAFFTESASTCGATLNAGSTCTASIVFTPTASGSDSAVFTVTDNAANSPQTVAFTGTAIGTATAALTIDCSVASNTCPDTFTGAYTTANSQLATDPIAAGLFHGYADPSLRKDPNSSFAYMAYSWAHTLSDGTHVVDLHLASSANGGASFTYAGPLYQSYVLAQPAPTSTAYAPTNDTSTETIDLLPIPLTGASAGQTLWVQAHQQYLVAPTAGIYDQLNATNAIVVTAVQLAAPTSAGAPTTLLGLGQANTQSAVLGAGGTASNRGVTQSLTVLNAGIQKCTNWGQPTLWYQSPYLYLALECTETTGSLDNDELAHYLFYTTPSGTNAAAWTWAYVGEFATPTQAALLGTTSGEATAYKFFTEPEFVATKGGTGLGIILIPGAFNTSPTATQPVIQYGCRIVPITALSPTGITLQTDTTTGALAVVAKVTEADLEGTPTSVSGILNEGPAACTYDPALTNGIVMPRKFENDATYGFYLYPLNSTLLP